MATFTVKNNSKKRQPFRTDEGVIYLAPGETRENLPLQPSLKRYYDGIGHFDISGGEGEEAARPEGGKVPLSRLTEAQLREIAEKEKIDLGDLDLNNADDRQTAETIIAEFRRIYESGTVDHLRNEAAGLPNIDKEALDKATTKYAIVNLMLAAKGIVVTK